MAYPWERPCCPLGFRCPPGSQRCSPHTQRVLLRLKSGIVVREKTVSALSRCPPPSGLARAWFPLPYLISTRRRTHHRFRRWWTRPCCLPLRRQTLCLPCSRVSLRCRRPTSLCRRARRRPRRSEICFQPQKSTLAPLPSRRYDLRLENPTLHWAQGPLIVRWGKREVCRDVSPCHISRCDYSARFAQHSQCITPPVVEGWSYIPSLYYFRLQLVLTLNLTIPRFEKLHWALRECTAPHIV